MTNVGIDFMAFRNRLSLTVDWYVKNTKISYYLFQFLFRQVGLTIPYVMLVRFVIKV